MTLIIRIEPEQETDGLGLLMVEGVPFKTWKKGETMLPEGALKLLENAGITFKVIGPATYAHFEPVRDVASCDENGLVQAGARESVRPMNIDYTVNIWREGGQYVGHAMPLDVASSGADPDAARRAVDEAVRSFIASCANAGTLEEVLEEAGYERIDGRWQSPSWISVERREVAIA